MEKCQAKEAAELNTSCQKPSNSIAAGAAPKQLQLSAGEKRSESSGVIEESGERRDDENLLPDESKKRKMN